MVPAFSLCPRKSTLHCAHCGQALEANSQFCSRCGRPTPVSGAGLDEPTFVPVRANDVLEGKWRLERKIGEGGMGSVYLAHELLLDRQVAIKILSSGLAGDAEVVARFEREARVTASLEHPHIVPVYAVGRHQGRPFMVMKLLEGETLSSLLRHQGALSLEQALALFKQLSAGVDFIHSKGYVHRDIKTGNIFVGPDGLATILDFGILRPSRSAEALTRTGVVMGTPQYMSPEQALGTRDVDHRADLYALAVVLFECLAGRLPFESDNELELIQMQAHSAPPDLHELAPGIPRAVADVVKRALSKRPEDRYVSGAELVLALEAARADSLAAQPLLGPGLTAPSWRMRATGDLLPEPAAEAPAPEAPSTSMLVRAARPRRAPVLIALGALLVALGAISFTLLTRERNGGGEAPPPEPPRAEAELDAGALTVSLELEGFDGGVEEPPEPEQVDAGAPSALAEAAPSPPAKVHRPARRPPRKGGPGQLNVITTHRGEPYWAQVSVNGVARGRTPLLLELPEGSHRIRVERTGFRAQEREIKVASGRQAVLRIPLTQ